MKIVLHFLNLLVGMCLVPVLSVYGHNSTNDYTSYRRYPLCRPCETIKYPTNSAEVVAIVNEAIRREITVKGLGERHSQSDILCTEGFPIDMRKLKLFKMNSDNTVTLGAGLSLRDALDNLFPYRRSLKVFPAYANITIGGAIGTGAHGSSIKFHSSISAQIAKMTIVNGLGKVQVISSPEDLKSFKIHLGLLGIILDVTLYTVPLYKVKAHNYVRSDDVLTNGVAIEWAKTADQLALFWFPNFNELVVLNYTFVPADTRGNAWTHIIPTSSYESNVFSTMLVESAYNLSTSECTDAVDLGYEMLHLLESMNQPLYKAVPNTQPFYTNDEITFLNPAVGYPHEILASICSEETGPLRVGCVWAHGQYSTEFFDSEHGFSLNDLPEVINTIKDIVKKTPTAFPIQVQMRFSAKNDIYMSTSYQRDVVHMEFLLLKRTDPYNDAMGNLAGYQTIFHRIGHDV